MGHSWWGYVCGKQTRVVRTTDEYSNPTSNCERVAKMLREIVNPDLDSLEESMAPLLPSSIRMVTTIQMSRAFRVPGLKFYEPENKPEGCRILLCKLMGDLSMIEGGKVIYVTCNDEQGELELVSWEAD